MILLAFTREMFYGGTKKTIVGIQKYTRYSKYIIIYLLYTSPWTNHQTYRPKHANFPL